MRPKRAARRLSTSRLLSHLGDDGETDDESLPTSARDDGSETNNESSSDNDDSSLLIRESDSRATRVSSRIVNQTYVNYSAKHHPQDAHIPGFQHKARQQRKHQLRRIHKRKGSPGEDALSTVITPSSAAFGERDHSDAALPRQTKIRTSGDVWQRSSPIVLIDSRVSSTADRDAPSQLHSIHSGVSDDVDFGPPDDFDLQENAPFSRGAQVRFHQQGEKEYEVFLHQGDRFRTGLDHNFETLATLHEHQPLPNQKAIDALRPSIIVENRGSEAVEADDDATDSNQLSLDIDDAYLAPFKSTQRSMPEFTEGGDPTSQTMRLNGVSASERLPAKKAHDLQSTHQFNEEKSCKSTALPRPFNGSVDYPDYGVRMDSGGIRSNKHGGASDNDDNDHAYPTQEMVTPDTESGAVGDLHDKDESYILPVSQQKIADDFELPLPPRTIGKSQPRGGNHEDTARGLLDALSSDIARATQAMNDDEIVQAY